MSKASLTFKPILNRQAVISLESRKSCKVHGVLTDFVCLTCEKECCSQCCCRQQHHQIMSLSNFYKLVQQCMLRHSQMQSDLNQFLQKNSQDATQHKLRLKDQLSSFQTAFDMRVSEVIEQMQDLKKDMKRDFIDNLNEQSDLIAEQRQKLEQKFKNLTYWQDVYREAHLKKDTKELLSVFSVLRRDQAEVYQFKGQLDHLKQWQLSLSEQMTSRMEAEMSNISMKLSRRLMQIRQQVVDVKLEFQWPELPQAPCLVDQSLQQFDHIQEIDQNIGEALTTPRITTITDRQAAQKQSKLYRSMATLDQVCISARQPSQESEYPQMPKRKSSFELCTRSQERLKQSQKFLVETLERPLFTSRSTRFSTLSHFR